MDNSAEQVGRLVGVLLLACPALYFLVRGIRGSPRSRRLADLALFCGLLAFVMPETALGLSPANRYGVFLASGAVRVALGLVGIALAVASLFTRSDGGVGMARPMTGAGFSLLHMTAGAALLLFGSFSKPSTTWVYESPDGAYRLTLPSLHWKESATTGGVGIVRFVRPFPQMQASILSVKRDQAEAGFIQSAEARRGQVDSDPQLRARGKFREGTNAAGYRYHYFAGMDSSPEGKPVFVAYSVTWLSRKQMVIEVIFEGLPTMLSETGKAAEMEAIEKAAETICMSVE
jgi:hypothetical protein